jgi:hypothetical protein
MNKFEYYYIKIFNTINDDITVTINNFLTSKKIHDKTNYNLTNPPRYLIHSLIKDYSIIKYQGEFLLKYGNELLNYINENENLIPESIATEYRTTINKAIADYNSFITENHLYLYTYGII